MRLTDYNEHIFADLKNSAKSSWKNNGSLIYLSLVDQVIPSDSLVILGGRPRTGKTSLLLDFISRNSLLPTPQNKVFHNDIMPRRGLVFFIGQKQDIILRRWFEIINQDYGSDFDGQIFDYLKDKYLEMIEGAEIHFNFQSNADNLDSIILEEVENIDPDYVIVDHINCNLDSEEYGHFFYGNDNDLLNGLIHLQKKTKKMFLIASTLGHDAWYRSGYKNHCLEDLHSILIERNADMVLMLHRPELYGFDIDENGASLEGVVEIDTVLNRLGKAQITKQWGSIGNIPKLIK
jgi:hypothetical protein